MIEEVRNEYVEGCRKENGDFEKMEIRMGWNVVEEIGEKKEKKDGDDGVIKVGKGELEIWKEDGRWFNWGFVKWWE